MIYINIAKDYTETPGGRLIKEGEYSGEDFRERILYPKYMEAIKSNDKLTINFDGCFGYPSSFIDEAFAGLAKKIKNKNILDNIIIISNDDTTIPDVIKADLNDIDEDELK